MKISERSYQRLRRCAPIVWAVTRSCCKEVHSFAQPAIFTWSRGKSPECANMMCINARGRTCAMNGASRARCPPSVGGIRMSEIGRLIEPQLRRLRRYATSLTRDAERAEDLVQTCLVRALANQHRWREGTDLRAWLFTILHNEFISDLRSRSRERDRLPNADIGSVALPGADPELSYQVHELQNALAKLPASQREIVMRIGVEREAYHDVASTLNLPVGTVRSRMSRARETLRAMTDHPSMLRKTKPQT
jgi:RNA polymerase sigma-70 factor, ECF subfamily